VSQPAQVGGNDNAIVQAEWGNHLTVGIEQRNAQWILKSHITTYNEEGPNYHNDPEYCNVVMTNEIHADTPCVSSSGKPMKKKLDVYEDLDVDAIPILRSIHKEIWSQTGKGVTYQGKRYKLRKGSRGGEYILRNNRKIYVRWQGGSSVYNEDGFTSEFIEFIKAWRVLPVSLQRERLQEVILVDDAESASVMMIYHDNHGDDVDEERFVASFYVIEKDVLFEAFSISLIPISQRTHQQEATMERFQNRMTPVYKFVKVAV
jgi:hypothetical protein